MLKAALIRTVEIQFQKPYSAMKLSHTHAIATELTPGRLFLG